MSRHPYRVYPSTPAAAAVVGDEDGAAGGWRVWLMMTSRWRKTHKRTQPRRRHEMMTNPAMMTRATSSSPNQAKVVSLFENVRSNYGTNISVGQGR